jgi:putative toxin-antitoxin system antitoxin component (TIGR02293 family)
VEPKARRRGLALVRADLSSWARLDAFEVRAQVRRGLEYALLEALMEIFDLEREDLSRALDIPLRTLARRKLEKRLPPAESDRLARLARIAALATEALGGEEKAARWLKAPNRALGGEAPLGLLDTDAGSREVENVLGRIEHGVFS